MSLFRSNKAIHRTARRHNIQLTQLGRTGGKTVVGRQALTINPATSTLRSVRTLKAEVKPFESQI
jgi:hypothetical protein